MSKINQAQRICADTYDGGYFGHLFETPHDSHEDFIQELNNCGDGLFKLLMVELSAAEDCVGLDDAYNRVARAIEQLESLRQTIDNTLMGEQG